MIDYEITFEININCYIKFIIPCLEKELEGCEETTIVFHSNQMRYIISEYYCIGSDIEILNTLLKQAISNELQLDASITNDIGYMWNEDLIKTSQLADQGKHELIEDWVGQGYLLWSPRGFSTWLYNKNNKIIFEITPTYLWHHRDPKEGEDFITYEEFIKNYKPYFILELNKDTAQQWLNKTEELLTIINQNYERYEKLEQEKMKSNTRRKNNKKD